MKLATKLLYLLGESVQDAVKKGCKDNDLKFEKANKEHSVCSIAFSEKNKAYIGFSHRGMAIFRIGDRLFDADFTGGFSENELEKLPFTKRGSVTIKNLKQAREAACNFARYVS